MTPRPIDLLHRTILAEDPARALMDGYEDGWLAHLVPELKGLESDDRGHGLHKDNLRHTFVVVGRAPARTSVRLGALFHDIGKPATRRIEGRTVTFHHHEAVGARIARDRLRELGAEDDEVEAVAKVVRHSGDMRQGGEWSDAAVRRFLATTDGVTQDVIDLFRADCTSRNPRVHDEVRRTADLVEQRIAEVRQLDAERARRPVIDGQAVMARYGLDPGPEVGRLLTALLEHQRDTGDDLSQDDAWAFLDSLRA